MLQIKEVTRAVDQHVVLADLSLELAAGELVSVLGPTGSGKTSLLRLVMGLDLPDLGELSFDGRPLTRGAHNLVPPEQRGFSMVFERTLLLPFLNVEQNILIGARPDQTDTRQRLDGVLALLDLSALRARAVHGLSGGEQQRVALARSLFTAPRLLLLDEPFRNIDRPARSALIAALRDHLRERGAAAILVTHDRDEAFSFSQRIFLLRAGRLVRGDVPEALYRHPASPWDAQLLGECNLFSAEVARALFGYEPRGAGVRQIAVRPEHLEVSAAAPHNATLEEQRFFGFYRSLAFRLQDEEPALVTVLADQRFEVGGSYQLRLKRAELVVELTPAT